MRKTKFDVETYLGDHDYDSDEDGPEFGIELHFGKNPVFGCQLLFLVVTNRPSENKSPKKLNLGWQ